MASLLSLAQFDSSPILTTGCSARNVLAQFHSVAPFTKILFLEIYAESL